MTLVKFNNRPVHKTFDAVFNDLFNNFPVWNEGSNTLNTPPVNIHENKEAFALELSAPGLNKEDFAITVEKGLLTISYEKKEETQPGDQKTIRREFSQRSFKRSFNLDDTIDADNIQAQYENGILKLNLPKAEPAKNSTRQIDIR